MDKRVMKTKRAIHSAMTRLLSVKPIEEITVTELSNAAEINRKTFYSYYNSVYMVDFETLLQDPQTTFNTLARIIASDLDFYETILTNRNQVYFLQKIITSLKERIMALYFDRNSKDFELQEYMLEYIISGLVSVYQKWFKSGRKTDMEELSKYISMLAVNGVKSILTAPDEEKESL